jgi:hypothetical protein
MNTLPADNLDFAWDRPETAETLRAKLASAPPRERLDLIAWLLREAKVAEVWQFLTLAEVRDALPQIAPRLGPRRKLWEYLLRLAHELGRI